jgi:hypothetical protein
MAEKLIHLPIEEARAAKWRRGRDQYGPVFIGHPLEELDEELSDAMNYAEETARRGFPMVGIAEDLWRLCERIRAIYRAAPGIVAKGQSGEGRYVWLQIQQRNSGGDLLGKAHRAIPLGSHQAHGTERHLRFRNS